MLQAVRGPSRCDRPPPPRGNPAQPPTRPGRHRRTRHYGEPRLRGRCRQSATVPTIGRRSRRADGVRRVPRPEPQPPRRLQPAPAWHRRDRCPPRRPTDRPAPPVRSSGRLAAGEMPGPAVRPELRPAGGRSACAHQPPPPWPCRPPRLGPPGRARPPTGPHLPAQGHPRPGLRPLRPDPTPEPPLRRATPPKRPGRPPLATRTRHPPASRGPLVLPRWGRLLAGESGASTEQPPRPRPAPLHWRLHSPRPLVRPESHPRPDRRQPRLRRPGPGPTRPRSGHRSPVGSREPRPS